MTNSHFLSLAELARLYGIETSFSDGLGIQRQSPPEIVTSVLRSLGASLEGPEDATAALIEMQQSNARRVIEPFVVLWDGQISEIALQLPDRERRKILYCQVKNEAGEVWELENRPDQRTCIDEFDTGGETFVCVRIPFPSMPLGYYQLSINIGKHEGTASLIVAPQAAYSPPRAERLWGLFLPLYSLRTHRDWGVGDYTDLKELAAWTARHGAGFFGTLPLFPAFLDEPPDPSPYSPISRLFWNELYLDPTESPQWSSSRAAKRVFGQSTFQGELQKLRKTSLVDYRNAMAAKRTILKLLAQEFFAGESAGRHIEELIADSSEVREYAAFRAYQEEAGKGWREWPSPYREGSSPEDVCSQESYRYYLYLQWLCREQVSSVLKESSQLGIGLYLDLPLGTHPDGYDIWRHQELFAVNVSGGAPPDKFFTGGQTWGFPPLKPEACRQGRHSYFRKCLQFLLKSSDLIRIDHVMSLNRLYWVPEGASARDGVYVRYPAEELYSILCLESHRQRCTVVGEDLGTVPPEVREAMDRHQIVRMYVGQFEVTDDEEVPVREVPFPVVASLDTHDTPTFASFWRGLDLELRNKMGLLDAEEVTQESLRREELRRAIVSYFQVEGDPDDFDTQLSVLEHWLADIASGPAHYLLVNLEDLWLETQPQNVPGTSGDQTPNWRRKARYSLAEIQQMDQVTRILERINNMRKAFSVMNGEDS